MESTFKNSRETEFTQRVAAPWRDPRRADESTPVGVTASPARHPQWQRVAQLQALVKSSPRLADRGPAIQRQRRDPSGCVYVNKTSETVWLGEADEQNGHLFRKNVGHKATREELMAAITADVGALGDQANTRAWVTDSGRYDQAGEADTDPYRVRLYGTYGAPVATNYSVDVHFGPYHHGYIVRVEDHGASAPIADRPRAFGGGAPLADFSSRHHDRGDNTLMNDVGALGATKLARERTWDASTKLIGEGARFQPVAQIQSHLTDNSKFFVRRDDLNQSLRWIKFSDLWLTWSATFNKAFNISAAAIETHVRANDFERIAPGGGGTVPLGCGGGNPDNITVNRDYCLNDKAPATLDDTKKWHELNIALANGKLNQTKRNQVLHGLEAVPGVVWVNGTGTGKSYRITCWDSVDDATLQATLPEWATVRGAEVAAEEDEPETVIEEGVEESKAEATAPEGIPDCDLYRAINLELKHVTGDSNAKKAAKRAFKEAVDAGRVSGITPKHGRYVIGDSVDLATLIHDRLSAKVLELQPKEETDSASSSKADSVEQAEVTQKLVQKGASRMSRTKLAVSVVVLLGVYGALEYFKFVDFI